MLKGKSFLDYSFFFSPNDCENNDDTKIFLFTKEVTMNNYIVLFVVSTENCKNLKYYTS